MNNISLTDISLTKVSMLVAAVSLASFFVNADDAYTASENTITQTANIVENSTVAEVVENVAVEVVEKPSDKFTFTSLDSDKDSKLNREEVIAGNNEWLVKSFAVIDSNADNSLTEQELVEFVTRTTAISN